MTASIIVRTEGAYTAWTASTLDALGLKEEALEAAIVDRPAALVLDPIGLMHDRVAVFSQRRLRSGGGQTDIPDLILLTDHGDVVVVEVKRLVNPELRGRHVVAQVVGYAATLSSLAEDDLVRSLSGGRHATWLDLCREHFHGVRRVEQVAARLQRRVKDAEIDLVVACDAAPPELAEWVRAAGRQSALGFNLHVVEVAPLTGDGRTLHAWIPRSAARTEIIHRTVVTVRTEGGGVHVGVKNDSAEDVDEASRVGTPTDRRTLALQVLSPLAASLHLLPDALWSELVATHRAAGAAEWPEVRDAIAAPDDSGPKLLGRREDGFIWGRFGVNLTTGWRPSLFVGAYLLPFDHKQALLAPGTGGDFDLMVDVARGEDFDGDAFSAHPVFNELRARLRKDAGGWDFADHLAQPRPNRWHPVHLRRPLADVLSGAPTPEARRAQWMEAARDVVRVLLCGGELAELRRQFTG